MNKTALFICDMQIRAIKHLGYKNSLVTNINKFTHIANNKFPAVDKTPPKFISPFNNLPSCIFFSPNGICQFIKPVLTSNAVNFP